MITLGIESSCDETAIAIVANGKLLASSVSSQHDVHAKYGGVVPELASRRHMETIAPLLEHTLGKAHLKLANIQGVAATFAPGLAGALLVGLTTAKGIAFAHNLPFIGVNHLEGHINAVHLEYQGIPFPHVVLVVSGGHTSLYEVKAFGSYQLLGATRDDAAGEAFDKVAKFLGLGFPGGPHLEKLAALGNPKAFRFTRPKFNDDSAFDFSFSGIKTAAALAFERTADKTEQMKADLAASFQDHVVQFLTDRLFSAAAHTQAKAIVISGGVAANGHLRETVARPATVAKLPHFIPSRHLCTDNAAMIAYVGEQYLIRGKRSPWSQNAVASAEVGV
ncbi:MAG: tRNA (adenosine(37)-N6)-threonylcarbamoyltransferase complex transferase subunit TsaD [Deltaproteobacteria bacterium]|nr:tRNA (adenosine(37)-N6)-threonylcarbamoyltransferase complex transferase subunit TsaD [Deltaproteobacteria bacterium]